MAYDENDQEILATLGNNLGSIIANANLVSRVRKQVERQRQLYEITGRIRRSNDIETILQTSVNEIGQAIRAQNVRVRIYPPSQEEA
jgi:GAF domain-containing protein